MTEAHHGEDSTRESTKVLFRLTKDEDEYPPYEIESLWARPVESGYELDNIPFFAVGVSCGDIVSVTSGDGALYFKEVLKRSGHSTVRVITFDESIIPQLRAELKDLGCSSELSMLPNLIAVDVPPDVSYDIVASHLEEGERAERWEYEESSIVHG